MGKQESYNNNYSDLKECPGECPLHCMGREGYSSCGVGIGVFFLVQQCIVLIMRGSRAAYYSSFYQDATGETPSMGGQNKPLFLSQKRLEKLEELYASHKIAKEVVSRRMTAERVIKQYWY